MSSLSPAVTPVQFIELTPHGGSPAKRCNRALTHYTRPAGSRAPAIFFSYAPCPCVRCLSLLLLLELPLVEDELLALNDVAVAAATLARARGDTGEKAAAQELLLNG